MSGAWPGGPWIDALSWAVLGFFLVVNTFYGLQLVTAVLELRRSATLWGTEDRRRLASSSVAPRVTVLAPAYNEEATVEESLRALLTLEYPDLQVVLVNDGSTDGTLAVLKDAFALEPVHPVYWRRLVTEPVVGLFSSRIDPRLLVVDKRNGGKADALNAALNMAQGELVCAIDADTVIEADALLRLARPFLTDTRVLAAGGTIRLANGSTVSGGRVMDARAPRTLLAGVQAVEYLRAFLFGRLGWNRLGGNLIVSGAFGLFRREAVVSAGGYRHDTVGEDMELVARLRREARETGAPDLVRFVPDPVAWTEAPESLAVLGRQRDRWHRGLADVLWRHRRMMLNPRYGALGMVVFPYFVLVELLAPVIEVFGLLVLIPAALLGGLDGRFPLLFLLVGYGYAVVLSAVTLLLNESLHGKYAGTKERLLMVLWALLENFGYRQLTVIWRLRGLWNFMLGRGHWGTMTRQGFSRPAGTDGRLSALPAGQSAARPAQSGQSCMSS
jgi:cellulose synthase/poly-beta-1,6-N-acetylglucosamine synthase-like glycosyltransferase